MIKFPWPLIFGGSKVIVSPESRTSPKFCHRFLGPHHQQFRKGSLKSTRYCLSYLIPNGQTPPSHNLLNGVFFFKLTIKNKEQLRS